MKEKLKEERSVIKRKEFFFEKKKILSLRTRACVPQLALAPEGKKGEDD